MNWEQQYVKRNVSEIVGVPYVNKDSQNVALKIFRVGLSIDVADSQIEKCNIKVKYVRNNVEVNVSSKHIICLLFNDCAVKRNIFREKRKRKNKITTPILRSNVTSYRNQIRINESLIKYTQALFMKTKNLKREKGLCKRSWES